MFFKHKYYTTRSFILSHDDEKKQQQQQQLLSLTHLDDCKKYKLCKSLVWNISQSPISSIKHKPLQAPLLPSKRNRKLSQAALEQRTPT